jgi:hypothetical protein
MPSNVTHVHCFNHIMLIGFGYLFGATPVVESSSLWLKLFNFLEGTQMEAVRADFDPLTLLRYFSTDERNTKE